MGRSGDPAARRSGDPAIRRSGDPAIRRPSGPAAQRPSGPAVPSVKITGRPQAPRFPVWPRLGGLGRYRGPGPRLPGSRTA
ncbi:hypothetical protein C7R54_03630 [Achromobacter aloeverae]|uniref:Uncharacterized protein n=1 Tax=Achromobacter aloeverae TaxID=1750518 RepID=A0A4Q1HQK6_9BURK|nr:hypothetical protein C7R54_03630 [Achromobacter aloeverae]